MPFRLCLCGLILAVFCGCAGPKCTGVAVDTQVLNEKPRVQIVDDNATRPGFRAAMESWLRRNNYTFDVQPDGSRHDLEKLTLEFEGHWAWDIALFLSRASIHAYHEGQRVGNVEYKAANNFNTNKFGNAEERIGYFMDILFGKVSFAEGNRRISAPPAE